ncbi:MAG: hypothetical protein RLZZ175_1367 [Bacteroidota bacterium]|jgi:hypothetical protein
METLELQAKNNTPYINFDASTGIMVMKGRSTPENSVEYYEPITNWVLNYIQSPAENTIIKVQFEYFNTSSSKCILDVLKKFAEIHKAGKSAKVEWYFEEDDEDMKEAGEDYGDIVKMPFEVIEIPE